MARKSVVQKVQDLHKKFPLRTNYGFIYREKGDTLRRYSTVIIYCVIYDPERGHSLFAWNPHRRGQNWRAKEWSQWIVERGLDILISAVMLAINEKRGSNWEPRQVIGFHGDTYKSPVYVAQEGKDAIYRTENKRKKSRGNKTNKARK